MTDDDNDRFGRGIKYGAAISAAIWALVIWWTLA